MIAIARAVSNGELQLGGGADPAQTIAALCAIKVSARGRLHYIAMRALACGRPAAAGRGAAQRHELAQHRERASARPTPLPKHGDRGAATRCCTPGGGWKSRPLTTSKEPKQ